MARYDTLGWQNENALSSYPFTFDIFQQDLLVDARFVQFDDFLPILNSVVVNPDNLIFEISFDFGVKTGITLLKKVYALGSAYRSVRIYTPDGSRYLGVITAGIGAEVLWDNYVGRKFAPTASFCTDTVRSVPSKDAVYLFDSNYGDIELSRTAGDKTIFYNVSSDLNSITFNAVTGHSVDGLQPQGLRRINLVPAFNNNINLASNDIIKFTALNNNSLDVSLVSGTSSGTFVLPTLIA
jgi:hypothetical protein